MTDWIKRWQTGQTRWQQSKHNLRLKKWLPHLSLPLGSCVFVPLCGKSLDMIYLLEQGFEVIGVELSELAVQDFFKQHQLHYATRQVNGLKYYQAEGIQIFVGDFFHTSKKMLSQVNCVYDRASLIALPADIRVKYAQHLKTVLPKKVSILLLTMNYPQMQKSGPPFAVSPDEVGQLFQDGFVCEVLEKIQDLDNEPKFIAAGVDFLEKSSYKINRI